MISPTDRIKRCIFSAILFATFPLAMLSQKFFADSDFTFCIFRTITGKQCPFCGLTRAFGQFLSGNLHEASLIHPLWWVAAALIVVIGIILLIDGITGKDHMRYISSCWRSYSWLIIAIIIVIAIIR